MEIALTNEEREIIQAVVDKGMKIARANESVFFSHPLTMSYLLLLLLTSPCPPSCYKMEHAITLQRQHEPCNNLFSTHGC